MSHRFPSPVRFGMLAALLTLAVGAAPLLAQCDTTITVNWANDEEPGSESRTCNFDDNPYNPAAANRCTFRRAFFEAAGRDTATYGTICIEFDLTYNNDGSSEAADDVHYDPVADIWTLPVDSGAGTVPLELSSKISSVDDEGPIVFQGPDPAPRGGTGMVLPKVYLDTDLTLQFFKDQITVRNLGFLGGTGVHFHEPGNTYENNVWGLRQDGETIDTDETGSLSSSSMAGPHGVLVLGGADNTVITNNVFAGAFTRAIEVQGSTDNTVVTNNYVGTTVDGTVPDGRDNECQANTTFDPDDWYGGWGISVSGSNATITNNLIAGMQNFRSTNDTAPIALEVLGDGHDVSDNVIGEDAGGYAAGVCGQAIKFSGTNHDIKDNRIVRARKGFGNVRGAILWSDASNTDDGGNEVIGNTSIDFVVVDQLNDGPGKLFEMSASISSSIKSFQSAEITSFVGQDIEGQAVVGTMGNPLDQPSPCNGCRIDFYLDDLDLDAEALMHLGHVIADSSGDFTFTLPICVPDGYGVRTMSTALAGGVIGTTLANTTAQPSQDRDWLPASEVQLRGVYVPTSNPCFIFGDGFESGTATAWN